MFNVSLNMRAFVVKSYLILSISPLLWFILVKGHLESIRGKERLVSDRTLKQRSSSL